MDIKKIYVKGGILILSTHFKFNDVYAKCGPECEKKADEVIPHDLVIQPLSKYKGDENCIFYARDFVSAMCNTSYDDAIVYPHDHYLTFIAETYNVDKFLETDFEDPACQQDLYRMILLGIFSAFEFFLVQVLITCFSEHNDAYNKYLLYRKNIDKNVDTSDKGKLLNIIRKELNSSNTKYLNEMFGYVAIKFPVYDNEMNNFVRFRHLSVHRAGYMMNDTKIQLDKALIEKLLNKVKGYVQGIDKQL